MSLEVRISTPVLEGVFQASKYLKFQVLCDPEELKTLFDAFSFSLYPLSGLGNGLPIAKEAFLEEYAVWIEGLKKGIVPSDADLRKMLASAMTTELDALWLQEVPGKRFLTKMAKPVIQIQAHFFTYSHLDAVFRPMSMGAESIFWGLQFSFPQIYQEPKTMQLLEVEESPNSEAFQKIRQWVRDVTRPTPFVVDGKRTNVPIRLGKNCFSWINQHPGLIEKGIYVERISAS